jgi:diaminohydroxyphosphoribosylaminopyrimidine deaminase/5-amino-6-(5-phosphoribosylamino)uracil reductase
MRRALVLAKRGYGGTSPNPMVGAVLVHSGRIVGEGWHQCAGEAHAEIKAIEDALPKISTLRNTTLYVTLEPCSTSGRTPPCTETIIRLGIPRVVVAATDPNPKHAGRGFRLLRKKDIEVQHGLFAEEAEHLNEVFNHWIVTRRPFVLLKAAMTLDGKIATRTGESKWITSEKAREHAMRLRIGSDAVLVGINTILKDDPSLDLRPVSQTNIPTSKRFIRIVLDPECRIPRDAAIFKRHKEFPVLLITSRRVPWKRLKTFSDRACPLMPPLKNDKFDLNSLMGTLETLTITNLLVEGGSETHAQFLEQKLGDRVAFFYAPRIAGGRNAPKSVGGTGLPEGLQLGNPEWSQFGPDLFLTACIDRSAP